MNKEQIDSLISDMLEWVSVVTQEVIAESDKYPEEQRQIFCKGAAWMLYRLVKNKGQRHVYTGEDMSLEDAIKHCEDVLPLAENGQCAKEHIQLRDWLLELKKYREINS